MCTMPALWISLAIAVGLIASACGYHSEIIKKLMEQTKKHPVEKKVHAVEVLRGVHHAIRTEDTSYRFPKGHFAIFKKMARDPVGFRKAINALRKAASLTPLDDCLCADSRLPTGACSPDMYWVLSEDGLFNSMFSACSRRRVALYISETPLAVCGGRE